MPEPREHRSHLYICLPLSDSKRQEDRRHVLTPMVSPSAGTCLAPVHHFLCMLDEGMIPAKNTILCQVSCFCTPFPCKRGRGGRSHTGKQCSVNRTSPHGTKKVNPWCIAWAVAPELARMTTWNHSGGWASAEATGGSSLRVIG